MKVKTLDVHELNILTELFDYKDVGQMIQECTHDIQAGNIAIFVLYDEEVLVGELRVMYENADENYAIRGRRAYLYAFRVRESQQNKGYGTYLLKTVLSLLEKDGYYEFTVGVEDDNLKAIHMYQSLGFTGFLLRKRETYQGAVYDYNLYLKRVN